MARRTYDGESRIADIENPGSHFFIPHTLKEVVVGFDPKNNEKIWDYRWVCKCSEIRSLSRLDKN